MKYLIIAAILVVAGSFYFVNESNKTKAEAERLRQAEIIQQEKIKAEEEKDAILKQKLESKARTDEEIKKLQSRYMMDYLDAKAIVESPKLSLSGKQFYADLGARWSDVLKVAGATSRITLSQPVQNMQEIKRELEHRKPETICEDKMKQELLKAYGFAIEGFLKFMQENEISSAGFMSASNGFQQNANVLIEYC